MKPRTGSASEFVLETLRQYPDQEFQVADLTDLAGGRWTKANIGLSLKSLLADGQVVRTKDGHDAWWAIAVPPKAEVAPPSPRVRPINVIRNGRW